MLLISTRLAPDKVLQVVSYASKIITDVDADDLITIWLSLTAAHNQ
jgi:hypothetical protein